MEINDIEKKDQFSHAPGPCDQKGVDDIDVTEIVNVSGHRQELDRSLGFWSVCAVSILTDNAWAAGAGSLVVALYDGGAPGVLYELIAASLLYFLVGAALAELASAVPSSASVYHWASVTAGPRYGRVCSWYAGWWNLLAWTFGCSSACLFGANAVVASYSLYHPDFTPKRWQIFIAYLVITWTCCSVVLFGQRLLPRIANSSAMLCLAIWFVTLLVCATMPSRTGYGYASNSFIWTEWRNQTGYSSSGFVFLAGMLNGAYAIGTPDGCSHVAEEVPNAKRNVPKGVAAQLITGFLTTFTFYLTILYAVTDINEVYTSPFSEFPLAAIYLQATRSRAGTVAFLVLFTIDQLVTIPGTYLTTGRMLWTLARDNAVPFSSTVARVNPTYRNPFIATFLIGVACTILGCIYVGSQSAFNAFVGVFAILTTMSYLAAILPHILTKRRYITPGPFWIPSLWGYIVPVGASAYIIVFNVIYCFPYALPTSAASMNYSSLISGGLTIIVGVYYLWKRNHGYKGPHVLMEVEEEVMVVSATTAGKAGREDWEDKSRRRSINREGTEGQV